MTVLDFDVTWASKGFSVPGYGHSNSILGLARKILAQEPEARVEITSFGSTEAFFLNDSGEVVREDL